MSALKICPQCATEYPANERFCPRDGTALRSQDPQADLVGSIIADRYHVLRKLGEGGMGQVYLAEHVKMGRKSAVKVMHPGMVKDVDAISRFNREAANASRINHPNVAGIYDFGETPEGIIYLAMEFIEGQSLTSVIEQQGALVPARAADVLRQTADALGAAHDMGIVHRDLKPDNIMVTKARDGSDAVKVVDFGIAKVAGSDKQKVTKTGLVVGTPEYMSPEQLSGDKLDARSDIYSLGLVAFNMLTGLLPFPSESAQESMIMRLTDKPKALGEMRPEVSWPAELQAVMDRALARDMTQRYQTAPEFSRDFYRAVESMPATKAAQAGTQVIESEPVPATRVAAAGGRTAPMAAQPSARPAAVPQTPPKSKVGAFVGAGAVVVLLGGGALYATKILGPRGAPTDSGASQSGGVKPLASASGSRDSTAKPPGGSDSIGTVTAPKPDPVDSTSRLSKSTNRSSSTATSTTLVEQLRALAPQSRDSTQSEDAIQRRVDRLAAGARSSEEIYWVAVLRSDIKRVHQDAAAGCRILREAIPKVNAEQATGINRRLDVPACSNPSPEQ